MKRCRPVSWLLVFAFMFNLLLPAAPAAAFSLSDLLGQTASSTNANSSSGQGLLDILLGLFLGKYLGASSSSSSDKGTLPVKAGSLGGKEVVGFYAEWWGTDTSSYNDMYTNADVLKTIAPFWATLKEDGSVSDRGGVDHAAVVKFAHEHNISALLMVNNDKQNSQDAPIHKVLADKGLRTAAISNLLNYIKQYNLDGINIDFEMVPAEDRNNLTAFMRELSERLKPQGYIISIDVFPKQDETNDVSIAYDYKELAKYADKIMIMTYDNHGTWSDAGPIADVNWVEKNLKYALTFIPKNKLYLGVAGYGYDWSSKGVESLEYSGIMNLVQQFNANVLWDEAAKSPHFSYTGKDGVSHQVWFENKESLKYKLDLVNKYDIAGAALWKLGEEDAGDWQVFKDKHFKK
ncbi:MAG: glycoside hydrolase family 18 [Pelosinus sp.]|nr:glycoside hydrolase family 18 [Pelosinus sp.]